MSNRGIWRFDSYLSTENIQLEQAFAKDLMVWLGELFLRIVLPPNYLHT